LTGVPVLQCRERIAGHAHHRWSKHAWDYAAFFSNPSVRVAPEPQSSYCRVQQPFHWHDFLRCRGNRQPVGQP
jgi:hypothetical protein